MARPAPDPRSDPVPCPRVVECTSDPAGGGASSILTSWGGVALDCVDENTVVAFIERRLSDERRARLEAHVDVCASCRRLVGEIVRATPSLDATTVDVEPTSRAPSTERGGGFGRYLVLHEIGRGGMGIVYAAYDPELDRKVALKVMRQEHSRRSDAQERLLREARAMARLTHPNVVPVYDVGATDQRVFLAMELVEGTTLRTWAAAPNRTWREILDAHLAAAQGLVAAHALGIVHRDFKPTNVLVGKDGRVRVMDFGLATASSTHAQPESGRPRDEAPASFPELTMEGAIVGTPAYMAPEQHLGEAADTKSDQFSFCVSLWESLYGERPFEGATSQQIMQAIVEGKVKSAPKATRVPTYVRDALLVGLRLDPDERHRSMRALVAALQRDPRRRLRRGVGATLAAAALVAVALVAFTRDRRTDTLPIAAPCSGVRRDLDGIWDDARRAEITRAFLDTGAPDAEEQRARTLSAIDRWTERWISQDTASCVATRVDGKQSDTVFTLRNECFQRRLVALRSLVDVLARADAQTVEHAFDAAQSLPGVDACSALRVSASKVPPPDDAQAPRVEAVRRNLSLARTQRELWKFTEAKAKADDAIVEAKSIGYRPLEAEADLALGEIVTDDASAEKALLDAVWAAEACRDDEVAAQGWIDLVRLALRAKQPEKVDERAARASAAIERLDGDPALEAKLLAVLAEARAFVGKTEEQLDLERRALAELAKANALETADALDLLMRHVVTLFDVGRLKEARDAAEQLSALAPKVEGADGLAEAHARLDLGEIATQLGDDENGLARLAEARTIAEKFLAKSTSQSPPPAPSAKLDFLDADVDDEDDGSLGLALKEAVHVDVDRRTATRILAQCALSEAELRIDRGAPALAHAPLDRAASLVNDLGGAKFQLVSLLEDRSTLARLEGRLVEARKDAEAALDAERDSDPPTSPALAGPMRTLAEVDLLDHHVADAVDLLERARSSNVASPRARGEIAFALARARWERNATPSDRTEARRLADEARKALAAAEDAYSAALVARVDDWLASHRVETKP